MQCHTSGESHEHEHEHGHEHDHSQSKALIVRMWLCAIFTLPFLVDMVWHAIFTTSVLGPIWQCALATLVEIIGGWLFLKGCVAAIAKKSPDMNVLVTLGTGSAYILSIFNLIVDRTHLLYFESSAFIITFVLIGLVIEAKTQKSATSSFKALLSLQPEKTLRVKEDGSNEEILVEKVAIGDRLLIKAGQVLPVDGVLESEEGAFDEASLTGEAGAKHKAKGAKILAGSVNLTHTITLRAEKLGRDTVIGKTIELVKQASAQKPSVQRLADKISRVFVPCVLGIALVTCIVWLFIGVGLEKAIIDAVSVLVIACPCALGMATPIVTLVTSVKMARAGVLIREIEPFFKAHTLKAMIFDKTGTLTEKDLKVKNIEGPGGEKVWGPILMSLCYQSDHPISLAITKYLGEGIKSDQPVSEVKTHPGLGVEGVYKGQPLSFGSLSFAQSLNKKVPGQWQKEKEGSTSLLFLGEEFIAAVVLESSLKPSSKGVIEFLKSKGITPHLVSGDSQSVSQSVAKRLGIEHVKGKALPDDKMYYLKKLQEKGRVGMCGDGINDAAALVGADVSFAMGDGVDVAMQSASMGLIRGDIKAIETVINFAKKASHAIYANFIYAFIFNVVGIGVAALGLLQPGIAAAAMALSSILVVGNSTLLLKR